MIPSVVYDDSLVLILIFACLPSRSKSSGKYNSTVGSAKETLGRMTGTESWQRAGAEQRTRGQSEYEAARTQEYAEGMRGQMSGREHAIAGAVARDREQETDAGEPRSLSVMFT